MKENVVTLEGVVDDVKGHSFFTVKIPEGNTVLARVAGRSKRITRNLFPGVPVEVELSPYDLTKGRIVKVLRKKT